MHVCIVGGYMYMCWSLMCYVMNPIDNHIESVQKSCIKSLKYIRYVTTRFLLARLGAPGT